MKIATSANARTANAAQEGLNKGLRAAFSAGSVMGFVVVGLGLLYISLWYYFLQFWYGDPAHLILAAGQALEEAKSQAVAAADVRIWLRPAVRTRQESRMRSQQRKKHWRDRSNNNKNCGSTKYGTIQNMQKVGKKFEKTIDISTKNDYNCQAVQ